MEVIILAGGLGTRLRSEVKDVPKCMALINGQPFLYYILEYLKKFPVTNVILSVGYLKDIIIDWINENKENYKFTFEFAVEHMPLGTGGGIKYALSNAHDDNVIILNGDTLFNVDLNDIYNYHYNQNGNITLALKEMHDFDRYGNVNVLPDGHIQKFNEKAFCKDGYINGGIYVINRNAGIFNDTPDKFSFETEILEKQCVSDNIYGKIYNDYFIDIGIPEDYHKAEKEIGIII